MDLKTRTQTFHGDDKSWLRSSHGVDTGQAITLNLALFDLASEFANGFIPSGVPLAKVTSSGKYGRWDAGTQTDEVQSVVATGGDSGDFTFTFFGETTAAISFDATAAQVQAALELLPNIEPGDVTCAGGPLPTTPVTITFGGQYAGQNVPALVVTDNIANGTATISTSTPGATSGAATGGAGLETFAGFLLAPIDVTDGIYATETTGDRYGALLVHGIVDVSELPVTLSADAQSAIRRTLPGITLV